MLPFESEIVAKFE